MLSCTLAARAEACAGAELMRWMAREAPCLRCPLDRWPPTRRRRFGPSHGRPTHSVGSSPRRRQAHPCAHPGAPIRCPFSRGWKREVSAFVADATTPLRALRRSLRTRDGGFEHATRSSVLTPTVTLHLDLSLSLSVRAYLCRRCRRLQVRQLMICTKRSLSFLQASLTRPPPSLDRRLGCHRSSSWRPAGLSSLWTTPRPPRLPWATQPNHP